MREKDFWYYLNYWAQLASIILAPPLVGIFLGSWIDNVLRSGRIATLFLLILGIITGLWGMYKEVAK